MGEINDLTGADAALSEIAATERQMRKIVDGAKSEKDRIDSERDEVLQPLKNRVKELEKQLATWATVNRTEIFKSAKSVALTFGVISFRLSTKLKTVRKWTWKKVLGELQARGLTEAIRIKEDVDREVLHKWKDTQLAEIGVEREVRDVFGYDLNDDLEAVKP